MKKLLLAASVLGVCASPGALASYNLTVEDEVRLLINGGECNVDGEVPRYVEMHITTVAEGEENAGERQLDLVLVGDESQTLSCFEFDAGAGSDPNLFSVAASAGAGGDISPAGEIYAYLNQTVAFELTPDEGQVIDSATGCAGDLSGDVYQTGPISENCSVSVSFTEAPEITYDVTAQSGAGGSISPAGTQTVGEGETLSYTVVENEGYEVDTVNGCGGNFNREDLTFVTGPINSSCTINASFNSLDDGGDGGDGGSCNGETFQGDFSVNCDLWGEGWSKNTGTLSVDLNGTPLVFPFRTGSSNDYNGRFDITMAGSSGRRYMWVSREPAGDALNQVVLGDEVCSGRGGEFSLRWQQGPHYLYCSLEPNTTYFVNLTHPDCSSAECQSYFRNNVNGTPD